MAVSGVERTMVLHTLNADPEMCDAIADGTKTFEIRLDDRGYQVGDRLDLRRASKAEVKELHDLGRDQLARLHTSWSPARQARFAVLADCPRLQCTIVWKIRLIGAIVPAEPHWWKPVEAMQHGVAVMGIKPENDQRS